METEIAIGARPTSPGRTSNDAGHTSVEPSELNVRRMNTCTKMNAVMKERSKDADLIALNLPDCEESDHPWVYMGLLEELVDLSRVLVLEGGDGFKVGGVDLATVVLLPFVGRELHLVQLQRA